MSTSRAMIVASTLIVLTLCLLPLRSWSVAERQVEPLVLHVWKAQREMWLVEGGQIQRKFDVALGNQPTTSKVHRGDGRTPEGRYFICAKKPQSRFRRFLGISYPNVHDADRAYAERLISADEWADILFATLRGTAPPWSTALGGWVGIHGYGDREEIDFNWTEGCIAISNADIDYLYDRVSIGTPVIISD